MCVFPTQENYPKRERDGVTRASAAATPSEDSQPSKATAAKSAARASKMLEPDPNPVTKPANNPPKLQQFGDEPESDLEDVLIDQEDSDKVRDQRRADLESRISQVKAMPTSQYFDFDCFTKPRRNLDV